MSGTMNSVKNTFNHSSVHCPVDVKLSLKLEADQQNIRLHFMKFKHFHVTFLYFWTERVLQLKTCTYFFVIHLATWMHFTLYLLQFWPCIYINKVNNEWINAVISLFYKFCIISHPFIVNRSTKTSHTYHCCENARVFQYFTPTTLSLR